MRSYTSSSNARLPEGPWLRTWIVAVIAVLTALGIWELYWRSMGLMPSIPDDPAGWVNARRDVVRNSTVFSGSSRILSGLEPESWKSEMGGGSPVQLGVSGSSPTPVLEDLANDESFAGLVVVDLIPFMTFDATRVSEVWATEVLDEYHATFVSPRKLSESTMKRFISGRLLVSSPSLAPRQLISSLLQGKWPRQAFHSMRRDRFRPLDFTTVDREPLMRDAYAGVSKNGRPATDLEMKAILERIETAVSRIQLRGGQVVFVHLPSCGIVKMMEQRRYPRERYWNKLVAHASAVTIHSDDYPSLSDYDCQDGSHLDIRDVGTFTRALARIVKEHLNI